MLLIWSVVFGVLGLVCVGEVLVLRSLISWLVGAKKGERERPSAREPYPVPLKKKRGEKEKRKQRKIGRL